MSRLSAVIGLGLAMGLASLSCSLFTPGAAPSPQPDTDAIATSVEATVRALQNHQVVPAVETPPLLEETPVQVITRTPLAATAPPTEVPQVLPAALYFLAPDSQGVNQIWRLAPDAVHFAALTAEAGPVTDYDVSTAGKLAYITQNQLVIRDPNTGERVTAADGGPDDNSDAFNFMKKIERPVWSPDGKTLAFGLNGINLLQIETGPAARVLPNDIKDTNGFLMPRALYRPDKWSPDGTRLLVDVGYYEGAGKAVYLLASNTVVLLSKGDLGGASCCAASWSPDSQSIFSAGFTYGSSSSDLWRYDAATGKGTQLIPEVAPDGTYNYTDWPLLLARGRLVYFFTNQTSIPASDNALLVKMTASDPDGVTERKFLREDPVHISEALWAADGSLAVVVLPAPGSTDYPAHGSIGVLYPDQRPIAQVIHDGRLLRWGP